MAATTAAARDIVAGMQRVVQGAQGQDGFIMDAPQRPNRGNKLKRKDHPVGEGSTVGQRPYKKRIEHSGYHRYILHHKPKRYDEDGYELDDDEVDEAADQEAAFKDPYSEVSIEKLMMPLTAASELDTHPTLSLPYKSSVLHDMTEQAGQTLQKERRLLADLKLLVTELRGDHTWIPGGAFHTERDEKLYVMDPVVAAQQESLSAAESIATRAEKEQDALMAAVLGTNANPLSNGSAAGHGIATTTAPAKATRSDNDKLSIATNGVVETPARTAEEQTAQVGSGVALQNGPDDGMVSPSATPSKPAPDKPADESDLGPTLSSELPGDETTTAAPTEPPAQGADNGDGGSSPAPRMVTRGQAQAQATTHAERAASASPAGPPAIHPLFRWPAGAQPDRGCGLPAAEADETRRVLGALVQKQEEVCHGTAQLYEGLLRAQRRARTVRAWCRAEAHVGEMSDGEDWVDGEEWGLDAPLKKGQEEAEEPGEKKTRGRRTAQ